MIDNEAYLVVKFWVNIVKYEIGIPVSKRIIEWMRAFCAIIDKNWINDFYLSIG